jgi:hypothetical protein
MSEPFGDPRGECVLCGRAAVEDVDATNVDGDLIHDECLAMEEPDDLYLLPSPSALFAMAARGLRAPYDR